MLMSFDITHIFSTLNTTKAQAREREREVNETKLFHMHGRFFFFPCESRHHITGGALAAIKSSFIQITIAKLNAVVIVAIVVCAVSVLPFRLHIKFHAVSFHLNRGQKAYIHNIISTARAFALFVVAVVDVAGCCRTIAHLALAHSAIADIRSVNGIIQ